MASLAISSLSRRCLVTRFSNQTLNKLLSVKRVIDILICWWALVGSNSWVSLAGGFLILSVGFFLGLLLVGLALVGLLSLFCCSCSCLLSLLGCLLGYSCLVGFRTLLGGLLSVLLDDLFGSSGLTLSVLLSVLILLSALIVLVTKRRPIPPLNSL